MTISEIKERYALINETIYFDPHDFLREKSTQPDKLYEVIGEAENMLKSEELLNLDDWYFLNGMIGNLYRISGQPKKAIVALSATLERARVANNGKQEIIALIRLGEALKYDSKKIEAIEMFDEALEKCKEEPSYLDFALQHKGKCLMELRKLEDAILCLEHALAIRKEKGLPSLIESTELALQLATQIQDEMRFDEKSDGKQS